MFINCGDRFRYYQLAKLVVIINTFGTGRAGPSCFLRRAARLDRRLQALLPDELSQPVELGMAKNPKNTPKRQSNGWASCAFPCCRTRRAFARPADHEVRDHHGDPHGEQNASEHQIEKSPTRISREGVGWRKCRTTLSGYGSIEMFMRALPAFPPPRRPPLSTRKTRR